MTTIAVIDYGMGNLHSVASAFQRVAPGVRVDVSADPGRILRADRVLFPGVGAIRDCMDELRRLELVAAIHECADSKPFLGICLGMQALMDFSEENDGTECLGVVPGLVRRFGEIRVTHGTRERLKIPHMGWNSVQQVRPHRLWRHIPDGSRFYFVHSYYVQPARSELTAGACEYGVHFAAALAKDNVFAVQFHPEKSQHAGLTLLANFVEWDGTE